MAAVRAFPPSCPSCSSFASDVGNDTDSHRHDKQTRTGCTIHSPPPPPPFFLFVCLFVCLFVLFCFVFCCCFVLFCFLPRKERLRLVGWLDGWLLLLLLFSLVSDAISTIYMSKTTDWKIAPGGYSRWFMCSAVPTTVFQYNESLCFYFLFLFYSHVVKASASRATDPGFDSRYEIFFRVESYQ